MDRTELLSRERLAGYDPERLERAVILLVGAGAAGCNIALDLALSGVGELRVVDFDHVEASNVSRAPLFRRERLVGGRVRHKARELAQGFLAFSYAANPLARFAVAPVQALGLGAFQGVDVVISAVDGFRDRAWLSDAARACGVPFIEVGFSAPRGHVSVFPNRSSEEPGWRCLMPGADTGGISCALYARQVADEGRVPATQTVAATFGALAAEAAILALHGEFPLGGHLRDLDIRTGQGTSLRVASDPLCRSHHTHRDVLRVEVATSAPLAALFEAVREFAHEPVVHLPAPFLLQAPCALCGASVHVGKPSWAVRDPPTCRTCPKVAQLHGAGVLSQSTVTPDDELAARPCRALGIAPGAIVLVEDLRSGTSRAVRVAGSPDDLFLSRRRESASASDDAPPAPPSDGAAPTPAAPGDVAN
jgi:molybdopterin/thiamine biosynthesis adenylyltransferase